MGIINNDSIILHSGIEVFDTYYSLYRCSLSLTNKSTGERSFQVDFGVWKDEQTRKLTINDEFSPLKHHTIIIDNLSDVDLQKNLYDLAYELLKKEITNYTDVL